MGIGGFGKPVGAVRKDMPVLRFQLKAKGVGFKGIDARGKVRREERCRMSMWEWRDRGW